MEIDTNWYKFVSIACYAKATASTHTLKHVLATASTHTLKQ